METKSSGGHESLPAECGEQISPMLGNMAKLPVVNHIALKDHYDMTNKINDMTEIIKIAHSGWIPKKRDIPHA